MTDGNIPKNIDADITQNACYSNQRAHFDRQLSTLTMHMSYLVDGSFPMKIPPSPPEPRGGHLEHSTTIFGFRKIFDFIITTPDDYRHHLSQPDPVFVVAVVS